MSNNPARENSNFSGRGFKSEPVTRTVGFALEGQDAAVEEMLSRHAQGSPSPVIIPAVIGKGLPSSSLNKTGNFSKIEEGTEGTNSPAEAGDAGGVSGDTVAGGGAAGAAGAGVGPARELSGSKKVVVLPPTASNTRTGFPPRKQTASTCLLADHDQSMAHPSPTVSIASEPCPTTGLNDLVQGPNEPSDSWHGPPPDASLPSDPVSPVASTAVAVSSETGAVGGATSALQKEKTKPDNIPPPKEKPKLTRAERREIQEKQRAEKEAKKAAAGGGGGGGGGKSGGAGAERDSARISESSTSGPGKKAEAAGPNVTGASQTKGAKPAGGQQPAEAAPSPAAQVPVKTRPDYVDIFSHLPQFNPDARQQILSRGGVKGAPAACLQGMPAVAVQLGMQYMSGQIRGGSSRCTALLRMFQAVIQDYVTPPNKSLFRDLTLRISQIISFLTQCRPLSASMGNAIRWLKLEIGSLSQEGMSDSEVKSTLIESIDNFILTKIVIAGQQIVSHAVSKIQKDDVVLTYAMSEIVLTALLTAHSVGCRFRVVVINSRPKNEGRDSLRKLLAAGVQCSYCDLNALAYIMPEVTKVFLGAASVTANGSVVSRAGTAMVAMVAHHAGIPVMICCETCKFQEKVVLDSIGSNELGNPAELRGRLGVNVKEDQKDVTKDSKINFVNLTYDAMPREYITMIITEFGMIPPTSVPVIIREYRSEPKM